MWIVIVGIALIGVLYFYYHHKMTKTANASEQMQKETVITFENGVILINSEEGLIIATSRGEVIRD